VVDLTSDEVKPGDVYLLCSDGLSGMLNDDTILAEVTEFQAQAADRVKNPKDLEDLCSLLVRKANEAGGEDNITALAIRIDETEDVPSSQRRSTQPGPAPGSTPGTAKTPSPPSG